MQGASRESLGAARERLDTLATVPGTDMVQLAQELDSVVILLDGTVSLRRVLTDATRSGTASRRTGLGYHRGPARWTRPHALVTAS
jgi:F-type H+-transporting ATPase subunit delta